MIDKKRAIKMVARNVKAAESALWGILYQDNDIEIVVNSIRGGEVVHTRKYRFKYYEKTNTLLLTECGEPMYGGHRDFVVCDIKTNDKKWSEQGFDTLGLLMSYRDLSLLSY